jgi:hypothetical protein
VFFFFERQHFRILQEASAIEFDAILDPIYSDFRGWQARVRNKNRAKQQLTAASAAD